MSTALATPPAIGLIPGADVLSRQSTELSTRVEGIVVTDPRSAGEAALMKHEAKALLKQIGDTFDPLIESAHKQHRALIATKKSFTDPIDRNVLLPVNTALTGYERRCEQQRREEHERQMAAARREREAVAFAEAQMLAAQGEHEAAEQVLEQEIEAPAPVVMVPREKIEGVSFRSVWDWWITDLGKIPGHLLMVKENPANGLLQEVSTTGIGALVRSLKSQATKQIPGIEVKERKIAV